MLKTFWWMPLSWLLSIVWVAFDIRAWYLAYGPTVTLWVWLGIPVFGLLVTILWIAYYARKG